MAIQVDPLIISGIGLPHSLTVDQQTNLGAKREDALRWLNVFGQTFGHTPYFIEARTPDGIPLGHLPLCLVQSRLFGRFLVSLPYLNSSGVATSFPDVATQLVDRAVRLADELDVRHLELRHEQPIKSTHFNDVMDRKVHMRLDLPSDIPTLWGGLKAKVRNQVRKGEKHDLRIEWGTHPAIVRDFYSVFSHNMRDLGTPVYPRSLFETILAQFSCAELAVTYFENKPIAAAYLQHDEAATCVPSASSLRHYNWTNANMWMYWQLLSRAITRKAIVFDFGRSTVGEGTYKFKKQWGSLPCSATWQYYCRSGERQAVRPDNPKYQRMIRVWQHLPIWIANLLGPKIVRGIP